MFLLFVFLMIRRPPRSTQSRSSAASDVYKRQLGSGAIGYVNGVCYANTFDIEGYIQELEQGRLPLEAARTFDFADRIRYDFLMKLFSTRLNVRELEEKYEGLFLKTLCQEMAAVTLAGAFRYFSPNLHLTPWGRYYWVIMMREFFIAVNNFRDYCRRQAGQVQLP